MEEKLEKYIKRFKAKKRYIFDMKSVELEEVSDSLIDVTKGHKLL